MKKYIIEIKLKKEKFARYYYDRTRESFGFCNDEFWLEDIFPKLFNFKNIDYFRIIVQGE